MACALQNDVGGRGPYVGGRGPYVGGRGPPLRVMDMLRGGGLRPRDGRDLLWADAVRMWADAVRMWADAVRRYG